MATIRVMSEPAALLDALKHTLRVRRVTYRALARRIGMSESGVKKLFSAGDCSLSRLEIMCVAIGVSVADLAAHAEAARRQPVRLSRSQLVFFRANPPCFYFLWELINLGFDVNAVAKRHGLDDRDRRTYLTALASQRCLEVADGVAIDTYGFRHGIQIEADVATLLFHPQQDALLARARSLPKNDDASSLASLGMQVLRVRRQTVQELKDEAVARCAELDRRARRDAIGARPEDLVEIGMMGVMAPFTLADEISLRRPQIRRARP